ncbi:uncharacterized protein M6B38_402345 [Iris pallida]|uniref:Receptor-like serine/threonine-protein kinase n=1 Tax=Iris pallida TaxID=29817 RepID=A0AAX6FSU4_IRIPA|nr:uncharacterized protein M6B38_402345 [Iris pallida]
MLEEFPRKCSSFFLLLLLLVVGEICAADRTLISGDSTIVSPNRTFELGFFSADGAGSLYYLGIWYSSLPIRTYAWVANRLTATPTRTLSLTSAGRLSVLGPAGSPVWSTSNPLPASSLRLLDTGNLVLLSPSGETLWQSFVDSPADTWLPDMQVASLRPLVSWRSPSDPSPGLYSLRLLPGEFELLFNSSLRYWSSGNWTGTRFAAVPEMTVPYIYSFRFDNPFTPQASFVYSTQAPPPPDEIHPLLSRFVVDSSGRLLQYTWSPQSATWEAFWSRPESGCGVYARCGTLGLCTEGIRPCRCAASGLRPADPDAWGSGDFSAGCAVPCGSDDAFRDVGGVYFDGAVSVSAVGVGRSSCEDSCRSNFSCFGIRYDTDTKLCRNLYGNVYNLRNSTGSPVLYLRVPSTGGDDNDDDSLKTTKGKCRKSAVLIGSIGGSLAVLAMVSLFLVVLWRRRRRRRRKEMDDQEEGANCNLRVFSYKELSAATRGFSEKLGQGGFGAVFRGNLADATPIAVKRLERPGGGGGEREFRAEVRTIGAVQHVNLVRLRGFCCEDPHRILVYDCMPGGPLSAYLGRARRPGLLSWHDRFGIALGTARGIAYLHEDCHDRIIHCDIKPENILLDDGRVPYVADFGLAKLMGRDFSRVLATMRGTWGYVAPEWISGVAITTKADVYSYGMTLLEIIGGRRNVEAAAEAADKTGEGWYFPPWAARRIVEGDVTAVLDPALAGEYDAEELERAAKVAVWCIQDEEAARPTMGAVVKMLEGVMEVSPPPLPNLLQALVSGESFRRTGIVSVSDEEHSAEAHSMSTS